MNTLKAAGLIALGMAIGAGGMALAQITLPAPNGGLQAQALGSIDLGKAFPVMAGYSLSLRMTTVPPGAGRALHSHKDSPEIIHVVSGVLTEQRDGHPPEMLGPGANAINDETVSHAILNQGAAPVVFYATSVSKTAPAK